MKKNLFAMLLILALAATGLNPGMTAQASETGTEETVLNPMPPQFYESEDLFDKTENGYIRSFFNNGAIYIENYDNDFNIISRESYEVGMELPLFGGFYRGSDAFYIIEGQNNLEKNNDKEIIRVIKYDFNGNRVAAASISNKEGIWEAETRYPFNWSNLTITEYDGNLYIATGHEGYVDASVGQGHQGLYMISVDENTMEGEFIFGDFWHSFQKYLASDASGLYLLEESDGDRCTTVTKLDWTDLKENWNPDSSEFESRHSVLDYGGDKTSAWAIPTYASPAGLALSDDSVLTIGTSIDQSRYAEDGAGYLPRNLYLTVTPKAVMTKENTTLYEDHGDWAVITRPVHNKASEATSLKWITEEHDKNGQYVYNATITKINDGRFIIMWMQSWDENRVSVSENGALSGIITHYVFTDGNGEIVSREYTLNGNACCHPIVEGSDVVFYSYCNTAFDFITIDTKTGEYSIKKTYRIIPGDADRNGAVDANDALLVLRIAARLIESTPETESIADVDGNKTVDANDALLILQKAAKLIDRFPVEG